MVKRIRFDSESSATRLKAEVEAAGRKVATAARGAKVEPAETSDRRVDEKFSSRLASATRPLSESAVERTDSRGVRPSSLRGVGAREHESKTDLLRMKRLNLTT